VAPELRGEVGRPQALGPDPILEGPDERIVDGMGLVVNGLFAAEGQIEWLDLLGSISKLAKGVPLIAGPMPTSLIV
jgi:hypothetical protein